MTDEGPMVRSGWPQALSIYLLIIGWIAGLGMMQYDLRIAAAVVVGSSIPVAFIVRQVIRIRRALGKATLEMKETSVPMGWRGNVAYTRPLRGATLRAVTATLECEERVTSGSGRSTRTRSDVVSSAPLAPQPAPMLEQLRVTIPIAIPAAGPPSFICTDHEVIWFLRLQLQMEGCPDTRSSFRIQVVPAVAGR